MFTNPGAPTSVLTLYKVKSLGISAPKFPEFAKRFYADIKRQAKLGETGAVPSFVLRRVKARGVLRVGKDAKSKHHQKIKTQQPKTIVFVIINN